MEDFVVTRTMEELENAVKQGSRVIVAEGEDLPTAIDEYMETTSSLESGGWHQRIFKEGDLPEPFATLRERYDPLLGIPEGKDEAVYRFAKKGPWPETGAPKVTTTKKTAANRKNALKSTGPKTTAGKARASLNALKHGLRAVSLAVPDMEDPRDWEAHRLQVVRDLAPSGYLETVLSERAAALLWRLGRVVRYESLHVTTDLENVVEDYMKAHRYETAAVHPEDLKAMAEVAAEELALFKKLPKMKAGEKVEPMTAWGFVEKAAEAVDFELEEQDPEDEARILFTIDLEDIPEDEEVEEWEGWTAGRLRKALDEVAAKAKADPEDMREAVLLKLHKENFDRKAKADAAFKALERERRSLLLPKEDTLDKVSRYEAHLERALFRTLHELQRFQASRAGLALPPPAAVDVDVNIHQEAS